MKRFNTIFTEILEEFSDLTQELKRTDLQVERPGHVCSRVGRRSPESPSPATTNSCHDPFLC